MKKRLLLLAGILSIGLLTTGCKDNDPAQYFNDFGRNWFYLRFFEEGQTEYMYEVSAKDFASNADGTVTKGQVEKHMTPPQYYTFPDAYHYRNGQPFEFDRYEFLDHVKNGGIDEIINDVNNFQSKRYPTYIVEIVFSYKPVDYQITYLNVDGVDISNLPTSYNINTVATTLPEPKKDNYDFVGWFDDNDNQVTKLPVNKPTALHLTAKWSAAKYRIVYQNTYGIEFDNPTEFTVEDKNIILNPIESTAHYTFNGWKLNGEYVSVIKPSEHPEDIVLVADLTFTSYTVKYFVDGDLYQTDTFDYRTLKTYVMPDVPDKNYTTSKKWSTEVTELKNYNINAVYDLEVFTITYINPISSLFNPNPTSFTYYDDPIYLINFSDEPGQYSFNGFYLDGEKVTAINPKMAKNITIECRFTLTEYTANYYVDDVLWRSDTLTAANIDNYQMPNAPEKTHYTGTWDTSVAKLNNYEIHATYKPTEYRIVYSVPFEVENPNPTSYTYFDSSMIVLKDLPSQEGAYNFMGFFDVEGNEISEINPKNAVDVTIVCRFSYMVYTANFYVDGTLFTSIDFNISDIGQIDMPKVPEKENRSNGAWDQEITELKDYEIHATYVTEPYRITFFTNIEGYNVDPVTVPYGTTYQDLYNMLEYENKALVGLYTERQMNTRVDENEYVTSSVTLYAKWEDVIYITTAEGFNNIKNDLYGSYIVSNDIDFAGTSMPIFGSFKGKLDGRNHKISNFSSNNTNVNRFNAIFGVNTGSIKDIEFENGTFVMQGAASPGGTSSSPQKTGSELGFLTYQNNGTIENVKITNGTYKVKASKSGYSYHQISQILGLFTGENSSVGVMTNCIIDNATVNFEIVNSFGGVPGALFETGNSVVNIFCGTMAGVNNGTINNCKIINSAISTTVTYTQASQVESRDYTYSRAGGFIGQNRSKVNSCSMTGTFTFYQGSAPNLNYSYGGNGSSLIGWSEVGGFIGGNHNEPRDCYVSVNVTATGPLQLVVGTFAGCNGSSGKLSLCHSKNSKITASRNTSGAAKNAYARIGGFVGVNEGSTVNCVLEMDIENKPIVCTTFGSSDHVAVFAGWNGGSGYISKCLSYGTLSVNSGGIYHLFAYNTDGMIYECATINNFPNEMTGTYGGDSEEAEVLYSKALLLSEEILNTKLGLDVAGWIIEYGQFPKLPVEIAE